MPKFELTKSIEARKLNKRNMVPLPGPAVTISFGSVIENLEEVRDMGRFQYLLDFYESEWDELSRAIRAVEDSPAPTRQDSPSPAPMHVAEVKFHWQELHSTHGKLLRAKVPGGWLVSMPGAGVAFYPEPAHEWDGSTL